MTHILVQNSLNYNKAVMVDINVVRLVTTQSDGDYKYLLQASTSEKSSTNTKILPVYINNSKNYISLDTAVDAAVSKLMTPIDWGVLIEDKYAPLITKHVPYGDNVSIASFIHVQIEDRIPASGIDLSEMEVVLETGGIKFDITNDCIIKGSPFRYDIYWRPKKIVTKNY